MRLPIDPPVTTTPTPFDSPSPFATGTPSPATHHVLDKMNGWNFDWDAIRTVLGAYESSLWWLAIVMLAILILGTQLVFFPVCYRVLKMQATSAMRLSYLFSLFVAVVVFHWWMWHWIFVAMTHNYWVWLAWCLFALAWIALIVWTPKRRLEA